jgi:tetratricopeptide (TPR) repeat protein
MKRAILSVSVIAAYVAVVFLLVRPLSAEIAFASAKDLALHYKWAKAEAEFRNAIKFDPFNARYPAGLGDFLTAQARYAGRKAPLLSAAGRLYERALRLDPRNAEYRTALGLVEMASGDKGRAFSTFRAAELDDPNGFNPAYAAGMSGLDVWKDAGPDKRKFIARRLKTAISARPSESGEIYLKAWRATKDIGFLQDITPGGYAGESYLYYFIVSNDLWQFRAEVAGRLERLLEEEDPQAFMSARSARLKHLKAVTDRYLRTAVPGTVKRSIAAREWIGRALDGKNEFRDGKMYWSGTMYAVIGLSAGRSSINIRAKGEPAGGVAPYMIVELDGEVIGESYVKGPDWKDYSFSASSGGGLRVLSVTFANDGGNGKEDRNLYVGDAEVLQ